MREPHILKPTKTAKLPRRFIFFDTEAKVDIHIHDDDIQKLLHEGDEALEERERVLKPHDIYLICATFKHKTNSGSTQRIRRRYHSSDFPACKDRKLCADFWTDVEAYARMNEQLYMFAHNARYDVQVSGAVHYLVKMGYTVTSFNDENPFMMTFEKKFEYNERQQKYQRARDGVLVDDPKYKTITIISSTNYYQQSLYSLGKTFSLDKIDFDHGEIDRITAQLTRIGIETAEGKQLLADFWQRSDTYCDRDVDILETAMDALMNFVIREDLGSFKLTIASQAFSAFRHRFLHGHEIYIHADDEALKTERRAYAGGRTECLVQLGKVPKNVFYVDVNSMYPYVMKAFLYPKKLLKRWNFCDVERVRELMMDDYLVICDAYVQTEKPMFHKKDKRLIFPVGGFWTTLCTPELIKGINEGLIQEVRNVCIYEPGNYFESYVDYFYEKRLEAKANKDKVHDLLYKLFLNTLYGKTGQRNENWEPIADADPEIVDVRVEYDVETRTREYIKIFGGKVWRKNENGEREEAYNSFPMCAAHVTAYARMLLWEAIETAGLGHVYYCDTDSLMCDETGYARLQEAGMIDDKTLGKLKLEQVGSLVLYGCKDYKFILPVDGPKVKRSRGGQRRHQMHGRLRLSRRRLFKVETKIKGVSKNAKPVKPTADGKLRFAVTQWGGFSERLRSGSFTQYYNEVIIKTLRRDYNKGDVDGVMIRPFRLNEKEAERKAMRQAVAVEASDLFIADYLKHLCNTYGYIRTVRPGERHYEQYKAISRAWKMRYFRKEGVPLDVWCEDNGKPLDELFDELKTKKTKSVS